MGSINSATLLPSAIHGNHFGFLRCRLRFSIKADDFCSNAIRQSDAIVFLTNPFLPVWLRMQKGDHKAADHNGIFGLKKGGEVTGIRLSL